MEMNTEQAFHRHRRAFIIMHGDGGLILASENSDLSHEQMFSNLGFSATVVQQCLSKYPRGYYMDDVLCVYQGASMTPGTKWELTPENHSIVRQYLPALCEKLKLENDTTLYLGVIVGEIGHVWERINQTTIADFMNTR